MRITAVDLDVQREPFVRPFAFKGSAFHEKWNLVVRLDDEAGTRAYGLGGLAVLWSDARVFAAHTETGGNALMVATLEHALQAVRTVAWERPAELLAAVKPVAADFAGRVTGLGPDLQPTFVLNALVALDHAAWVLWARRHGVTVFDDWVPAPAAAALAHRQSRLVRAPAVGYNMPEAQVEALLAAGAGVLKLKIGHPGDEAEMVAGDEASLERLARVTRAATTVHTVDGGIALTLDANGRYRSLDALRRLLDRADDLDLLGRIVVLEEPFAPDVTEMVGDLPVLVAADESLHDAAQVARRADLGYGAVAVKPAGKTLSVAFDMVAAAQAAGMTAFVADNACVPALLEWNKNVAARLPAFPGLRGGLLESNGAENYGRWQEMLDRHPGASAPWVAARHGAWHLDAGYFRAAGGVLLDPEPYVERLRRRAPSARRRPDSRP